MGIPESKNVDLTQIRTDKSNPNMMGKKQFQALKDVIQKYGFLVPIITNKDYVIADGFHRYKAARELGMSQVPVISLDVDEVDRRILRQIMNKLKGEHQEELDIEEWKAIAEGDRIQELLDALPSEERKIQKILKQVTDTQEFKEDDFDEKEEIEEAQRELKVKAGDVWIIGDHRLICGDSTNKEVHEKLMQEEKADCTFTDPPYNVNFHGTQKGQFEEMSNDNMEDLEYCKLVEKWLYAMENNSKDSASHYICIDYRKYHKWINAIDEHDIDLLNCIVWDKVFAGLGYKYRFRHEFVIFAGKRDKVNWYGDTSSEDVFKLSKEQEPGEHMIDMKGYSIPLSDGRFLRVKLEEENPKRVPILEDSKFTFKTQSNKADDIYEGFSMNYFSQREMEYSEGIVHPTMKPVRLVGQLIRNSTKKGDIVADLCAGSGSTLIACEQSGRKARVIELDPVYCQVIINRWKKMTGKTASKETQQ